MKKFVCLIMALVLTLGVFATVPIVELPLGVTAEAASSSDLTFKLNDDGKSYYVSDCKESASGSLTIPSKYNGKSVTSVGERAFAWCTGLTSVTIPNSITSIDSYAFTYCSKLTTINVSSDNKNYTSVNGVLFNKNKTELVKYPDGKSNKSYSVPSTVKTIGDNAFKYCTSLTSVSIPKSVTCIGDYAFYYCTGLTSITLPNSVKTIGDNAFYGCTGMKSVTIPNSVTSMEYGCFGGCTSLTSVTIPNSVTSIGRDAFYRCSKLTAINVSSDNKNYSSTNGVLFNKNKTELIDCPEGKSKSYSVPSTVKTIGSNAFERCVGLTSVTIPNSVTSIGSWAFYYCTGLTSIRLPNSVSNIGYYAFEDCTSLASVTLSNGVTSIGNHAFDGCTALTSVTIPGSVTSIGYNLFYGCSKLTAINVSSDNKNYASVNGVLFNKNKTELVEYPWGKKGSYSIPSGVTNIATKAFYYCKNLTSVTFSSSVTSIGDMAFYSTGLKSVKLPNNLISIGYGAFEYCSDLSAIMIPDSVTGIGNNALAYCPNLTVYGEYGSYAQSYAENNGLEFLEAKKPATVKLSGVANVSKGVKVSWSKTANASTYTVYRKNGNDSYKAIKTGLTSTSYTDTTVKSGTKYTYTVRAVNVVGKGGYDNAGKTVMCLAMPKLSSASNTNGGVTVKWGKVTGAAGYYVYRKTGNGGWKQIATVKGNSKVSYTDKSAKSGTTYKYTVKAYNDKTVSAYNTSGVSIKYLAMPKLNSVSSAKAGVTVKWGKVTGASGYYVYRKTGNGSWKKITTVKGNGKVSYLDKSAKKGTTYTYTVKAYNGKTTSAYNTTGLKIKDKY